MSRLAVALGLCAVLAGCCNPCREVVDKDVFERVFLACVSGVERTVMQIDQCQFSAEIIATRTVCSETSCGQGVEG